MVVFNGLKKWMTLVCLLFKLSLSIKGSLLEDFFCETAFHCFYEVFLQQPVDLGYFFIRIIVPS